MSQPPRKRSWPRRLAIVAQVLVGLGLGLGAAEYAFSSRDDGAFPHVNFYVADPELGVRLEPGATMRFQLRPNPLTTIHVNGRGYRGGEWPAPSTDEVIVVGDSQVFGLGVEDDQTFSAALAGAAGRPVLNAGVPTYGPGEYLAVARELLAERHAKTVVVVLNFVNDPFEIDRPNRERHAVWDGWAVRSETAPASVSEFPGRKWLFSKSHAVYALRRWLHERGTVRAPESDEDTDPIDPGTPSEGGLKDLVVASQSAHAAADDAHREALAALDTSRKRFDSVDAEIKKARKDLDHKLAVASDNRDLDRFRLEVARGNPGDIVREDYGESSRAVQITAGLIREAAKIRDAELAAALKKEQGAGKRELADLIKTEADLIAEQKRLREQLAAGVPPPTRPPSRFHDYVAQFKAMCDEHGAELVVVALPIDVQVDAREWAKYGAADAPDMTASLILLDDLVADARALGVRALDATAALRGAQPGAFLDHDIHMTAKGHAALAAALAETLAAPPPKLRQDPGPGLPEGRSFVPTAAEWLDAPEVVVKGSTALGCTTQIQREWLRVQCRRRAAADRFVALEVREGGAPATMALRTVDGLSLVTPMTIGAPITARFFFKKDAHDLEIRWPEGDGGKPKFAGAFVKVAAAPPPEAAALKAAADDLCACYKKTARENLCALKGSVDDYDDVDGCERVCSSAWGDPGLLAACAAAHPGDDACAARLACAQHDPLFAPTCPEGQIHAFASNACFAICDADRPCAAGDCVPWQGGGVCR